VSPVPYDELDPPIRELVRVLTDGFSGIETIGSCGGHDDGSPGGMHASADERWVTFGLEPADASAQVAAPSDRAWLDMEFLVYWMSVLRREQGLDVEVFPWASPPHLNEPGRMLSFELRGWRQDGKGEPDEVAEWIRKGLNELYVETGNGY
jgi:hypothetical protein